MRQLLIYEVKMKLHGVVCLLIVTLVTTRESFAQDAGSDGGTSSAIAAGLNLAGKIIQGLNHLVETTYGRGVGRTPDKSPCPSGLRDDGTSCWRDAHIYGKGCCCFFGRCCNKCPSGYHDDGCTCRRTGVGIAVTLGHRQHCRSDEERYGALCYPKCKEGYVPQGCCICKQI